MNSSFISLIVPVFNESEVLNLFIDQIYNTLKNKNLIYEIIFVDDGSDDNTLTILLDLQKKFNEIKIIELSRNFGKEAALTAGLKLSIGDAVIILDVDLQDPPELIQPMIEKWRLGYEVVLCRRVNRDSDSWFKQKSALWFYKIHNWISDIQIPENVGDFRLLDRQVVKAVNELPESRRFMKGIFSWLGFRTTYIDYTRPTRIAGKTKFNGWKLWNFALEGITSFSTTPLKIWTYIGAIVALISFAFSIYILFRALFWGIDAPGYASIIISIVFLGGLQLIGIGILGEYIGRTYIESKRRPIYLIRKFHTFESKNNGS